MEIVSFHGLRTQANATPMPTDVAARRKRSRRTQAERSAETREKIIVAASACIAELGFSNTTMSSIAQGAGVTWGAMQHQFGAKDAIIDAVIDHSIAQFAAALEDLRATERHLGRRVHAFTDRAWGVFKAPTYRTVLDILLHRREKTARIAAAFTQLWGQIFGDLGLSPARQLAAQRFTFVMLSGIATESVVVPGVEASRDHFAVLERTLLGMLAGAPVKSRSAGRRRQSRRPGADGPPARRTGAS
ncbi:MAG: TetR/AcrR family transcriptional regulator [Candidatus Binatia bacterium]